MKLTTYILLFFTTYALLAQNEIGIFVQGQNGSAWVKNPTRPEDGTFGFNFEESFAAGLFKEKSLNPYWTLATCISYNQSAFSGVYSQDNFRQTTGFKTIHFHYIGLESKFKLNPKQKKFYLTGGVRMDRRIKHNLPKYIQNPQGTAPINSEEFKDWNLRGIAGLGYLYDSRLHFEGGLQSDLLYSLYAAEASIKQYYWYLQLGLKLF